MSKIRQFLNYLDGRLGDLNYKSNQDIDKNKEIEINARISELKSISNIARCIFDVED